MHKPEKDTEASKQGSTQGSTIVLDYYYDDPSETDLRGPLAIPPFPKGTPEFTVVGWKGLPDVPPDTPVPGTPAYQAAQVWGAMATTLSYVMGLKPANPFINNWSTTYNLVAIPRAGVQLNAYYDRSSLRFFWGKDPKTQKAIYTCDAVGIVSHELGHAILDAMRPDLWNTTVLEFFAFHEAFGDVLALATVLQHDVVIERMLEETTTTPGKIPDLWQSNVVSRLARQLGHAVYYSSNMVIGAEKYLRNAFNDFKYVDPITLSMGTADAVLTQEPHNFSRVFSGAWYECFCELFKNDYVNHDPGAAVPAVKAARDTMTIALLEATLTAPSRLRFLPAVATRMFHVLADGGKNKEAELVKKVLKRRNLFREEADNVHAPLTNTLNIDTPSSGHSMKAVIGATTTSASREINVDVPKWLGVPSGENPRDILSESINSAINYMTSQELIGGEADNNMFAITGDQKLIRNYICSSFRAMSMISKLSHVGQFAH